jgi:hypothetical protein
MGFGALIYIPVTFLTPHEDMRSAGKILCHVSSLRLVEASPGRGREKGCEDQQIEGGMEMSWIKREWKAQEADRWTKEDYLTFVISPIIYFLLALGVAFSLLLLWYGCIILGVSLILLVVMVKIIDPKLKATSEDYEHKQKEYLEDLEKIARWEE